MLSYWSEIHYDRGSLASRRPVRDPLVSLYDTLGAQGRNALAKVPEDRQAGIEQRLQELAQIFAVGVGGFSVMDNHLNVGRFARTSISTSSSRGTSMRDHYSKNPGDWDPSSQNGVPL